jgi:hypothetical protein
MKTGHHHSIPVPTKQAPSVPGLAITACTHIKFLQAYLRPDHFLAPSLARRRFACRIRARKAALGLLETASRSIRIAIISQNVGAGLVRRRVLVASALGSAAWVGVLRGILTSWTARFGGGAVLVRCRTVVRGCAWSYLLLLHHVRWCFYIDAGRFLPVEKYSTRHLDCDIRLYIYQFELLRCWSTPPSVWSSLQ